MNEKGIVSDIYLQKSTNYFLDKEAIRIIKLTSGKWSPGIQFNKKVKSYHQQSINFANPIAEEE